MVVVMDSEPERSAEEILDDCSQPSYREEEPLSEKSNVSLPSRKHPWMDTRLRTRMRAGGSRLHYQQFDYSTSDPERARSEDLLSGAPDHAAAEHHALVEASMPRNEHTYHLNLQITTRYQYSPNLKLSQNYLKGKMFPQLQQKPKCH